jgi:hypothetical protein
MRTQEVVKEGFIGVLNIAQVNMTRNIAFKMTELHPGALGLLLNGFNVVRQ